MPITPNMNLTLPTVTVTEGPLYASQVNAAITTIDAHDHSPGKGVTVKPSGININDDLDFNEHNADELKSTRYVDQLSVLADPEDLQCVYVVGGNLYYNNAAGVPVQITSGSSVNSSTDGISRSFETEETASNLAINPSDTFSFIGVDTTTSVIITLPAAAAVSSGRFYEVKDVTGNAETNPIVINADGSDLIDGQASFTLDYNYAHLRLVSDGVSKWSLNDINEQLDTKIEASSTTIFTTSGTWTKATKNPKFIKVTVIAGGGGSGGSDGGSATTVAEGAGGGGGGCSIKTIMAADLADTESVTVGVGGTAGASGGGSDGGTGGSSSFGSHCSAGGGGGGDGMGTATTSGIQPGGGGGVGSGGDENFTGDDGGHGYVFPSYSGSAVFGVVGHHNYGGGSYKGGIQHSTANTTGDSGITGQNYGGGASGGFGAPGSGTNRAGAVGGPGIVIVEEFY